MGSVMRLFAVLTILLLSSAATADAAELVAFESDECGWCEVWERDVGSIYQKTAEGRVLPLRRVDFDAPRPRDLEGVKGIVYTPTFVVVDGGREVGRIVGYPGEDFFWGMLGDIIDKQLEKNGGKEHAKIFIDSGR